jgi:hypothetical protein
MSAMTDMLLAPDVRPFAISAAIMIVLGGVELLTTLVGFSLSQVMGKDFAAEINADSGLNGLFLWINAGRLPLFILLILALGIFAIAGFFLQGLAHGVGISIPPLIASLVAAAASLPAIRVTSRGIARIIPRDETYVVDNDDFVGHVAEVSVGPLDQGLPGRVRLKDVFGNWHSLVARASPTSTPLPVGASVLLVDRDAKSFIAISAPADLIAQQHSDRA